MKKFQGMSREEEQEADLFSLLIEMSPEEREELFIAMRELADAYDLKRIVINAQIVGTAHKMMSLERTINRESRFMEMLQLEINASALRVAKLTEEMGKMLKPA